MTQSGNQPSKHRIAYFVSPHGFGHAARSAAVIAATQTLEPSTRFEIFTQVPRWFFEDSLKGSFGYHPVLTDIGLVQQNSLLENLSETLRRLGNFLPFDPRQIDNLAQTVSGQLRCEAVICDIAPLGIAVAQAANIPALLVENFTWDWIYQGYLNTNGQFGPHIAYLGKIFESADYHIQTEPVCLPKKVDLTTSPISRKISTSASQIRDKLGIPSQAKMVIITMGGSTWQYTFLEQLQTYPDAYFVIPGVSDRLEIRNNLVLPSKNSGLFHPDLINAANAVIGKAGYSTTAEAYQAGIPFGYVTRPNFRESKFLGDFINRDMRGIAITETQFQDGYWLSLLPDLLAIPRDNHRQPNGADQAAHFILAKLIGY